MERRPDDHEQIDGRAGDGGAYEDEAEARRRAERAQRNRLIKIALGLLLLILFVIFIVQNSEERTLRLIFTDVRVPLILVLLASAVIGSVITLLVGWPYRRTLKRYVRELEDERDGANPPRGR